MVMHFGLATEAVARMRKAERRVEEHEWVLEFTCDVVVVDGSLMLSDFERLVVAVQISDVGEASLLDVMCGTFQAALVVHEAGKGAEMF